jgi:RND family efflux transporter MFP subunit
LKLSRNILSLLTVLILFLAVGVGVVWRLLSQDEATATPTNPELPNIDGVEVVSADQWMGSQPVEGVPVIRDTLWLKVVAAGQAEASRRSTVATRGAGVVQRVFVKENAQVRAGDVLVQLDTVVAAMNLARAKNDLFRAQIQFEERMLLAGDISDASARANRERILRTELLATPELNVSEREMELEFTRVRAPFSGRVANLRAVEGAYMGNGAEVLTLLQLDPIKVEVNVLESDMSALAVGRRASVRFNALGGETLTAIVESVNPLVDPNTRAGRVTLTLPNPRGLILPGNYAWVSLDAEAFPELTLVPREAVLTRGDLHREMVFMLKAPDEQGRGIAEWRYVATGRRNETHIEIVPSEESPMLQPGEIVLVDGHQYLAHDIPVHLVENVVTAGGRPGR